MGFDNIDRAAANKHKIPFSNTADVLTDATAEFAFIIMGTRRPHDVAVRADGARADLVHLAPVPSRGWATR